MKKRLNKRYIVLLFCLATICLAGGCKKNDGATKPAQAPPKADPTAGPKAVAKPNAAVQKQVSTASVGKEAASYDFKGKKDPFKPLITPPETAAAKTPVPGKRKLVDALPIQSYEASKFIVTGIVTGFRENKALMIDPAGKAYVVKPGMLVGNNGGRITKITASSLEVTESYTDEKDRVKIRKIVLPLAKKSKETSR